MIVGADLSKRPLALASAGVGVVAVTFGMARYGLGLLAPDIRASFHLDEAALGLLAAASYGAYLLTSVTAAALSQRLGPRALVGTGGGCAVAGMITAGTAQAPAALFLGLLIAGASAGLVFPPFSDVIATALPEGERSRVLAVVSSGTGWGVALAAPIALLAGSSWRTAWLLFAAVAAVGTLWALGVLPSRTAPAHGRRPVPLRPGWFVCPRSGPLLIGALLIGLASSTYWTFAVEHLQGEGMSYAASRSFLAVVGLASIGGSVCGDLVLRWGARVTFTLAAFTEAAALLALGSGPAALAWALASAVLFGVAYNTLVAVTVIWSAAVFADRPSSGLAAVMTMTAMGCLVGPPLLGGVADRVGLPTVFALGAVLLVATAALAPRERLN